MKINLLISLLTVILVGLSKPALLAASNATQTTCHAVRSFGISSKVSNAKSLKRSKRNGWLKLWWENKIDKLFKKWRYIQRLSLGFVGLIVMILGGMFVVLGIVIPYLGILFLVIGIILAFVGLLLWLLLSRIGVRVSSGNEPTRREN